MSDEHPTVPGSERRTTIRRRGGVGSAGVRRRGGGACCGRIDPGGDPDHQRDGRHGRRERAVLDHAGERGCAALTSVTIMLYNQDSTTPALTQSGPPVGFLAPSFSSSGGSVTIVLSLTSALDSTSPLQTWYVDASLVTSNPQMSWGVQSITSTETVGILPPDGGVFTVTV